MKKFLPIAIVIAGMLLSCKPMYDGSSYYDGLIGLPEVRSVEEAWRISSSIRYVSDGDDQACKEPNDTLRDGYGDCEDIAALMLGLIEWSYIGTGKLAIVYTDVPNVLHALVYFNGMYYEAQWMYWYVFSPRVKEYWDLTFYMSLRTMYTDYTIE